MFLFGVFFIISLLADIVVSDVNSCTRNSAIRTSEYAVNIFFKYYDSEGQLYRISTIEHPESRQHLRDLHRNQKFAIIVPGWRENCEHDWVFDLIRNLLQHRGGTIICMDYIVYSSESYFRLMKHFDAISDILTTKLCDLEFVGLPPAVGFMFGFSFGGQIVAEAGRRIGPGRIKDIDICDMAGPGFESKSPPNHALSAQNVQCIHTSKDKGIRYSTCHQDWKMGNCGLTQDAAAKPPFGSHGLCPHFYNIAFKHDFYAIPRPQSCNSKPPGFSAHYPHGYKMGYLENRKGTVRGELYAITTKYYPYTIVPRTVSLLSDILKNYNDPFNRNASRNVTHSGYRLQNVENN
ncbi:pancreatic lipase-related protein 2 [Sergentomyia squamirostris]